MKILTVSKRDSRGGAARAAYRLHQSLCDFGHNSSMIVDIKSTCDHSVSEHKSVLNKLSAQAKPHLIRFVSNLVIPSSKLEYQSLAFFSSPWIKYINSIDVDIVHLHWTLGEMLSVEDIAKIKHPLFWTFHDMWPILSTKHYSHDVISSDRLFDSRQSHNIPNFLDHYVWRRKVNSLKPISRSINIVAPSEWMATCVKKSFLFRESNVSVIHNPINTDSWFSVDRNLSRKLLNLPPDSRIIAFGAMGGGQDKRKGFDLLLEAISLLKHRTDIPNICLLVFGQCRPLNPPYCPFPIFYTGHLSDDISLKTAYSAADLFVIPSRQDNLPNTALEAFACGTPVVSFDVGGLTDIIKHKVTGYLATSFDPTDLAHGMNWILSNANDYNLSFNARKFVVSSCSYQVISKKMTSLYQSKLLS